MLVWSFPYNLSNKCPNMLCLVRRYWKPCLNTATSILRPSKEASCIGPVTSLGSLVNCLHLIGYRLSLPPRVWEQSLHLGSGIKAITENFSLWSSHRLNAVEPESHYCASDRLRNRRRRRHVMRARGITLFIGLQDCLPSFLATCFDGWWTTNEKCILPYCHNLLLCRTYWNLSVMSSPFNCTVTSSSEIES